MTIDPNLITENGKVKVLLRGEAFDYEGSCVEYCGGARHGERFYLVSSKDKTFWISNFRQGKFQQVFTRVK